MTLNDCTRDELIFVVNQVIHRTGDYYVQLALAEVGDLRESGQFERAYQLSEVRCRALRESAELLRPYREPPYPDMPADVSARVNALLDECAAADREWRALKESAVK